MQMKEPFKVRLWLAILLAGTILLAGCSSGSARPPTNPSEVPRISVEELQSKLDSGQDVLIIDTRSSSSYAQQHIAGAISIPADQIGSRLGELPKDKEFVLY
jgi:hypothetical protein